MGSGYTLNWHQINPKSLVIDEVEYLCDQYPQVFTITLIGRLKNLRTNLNCSPQIEGELTVYSACGLEDYFEVDFSCFLKNDFQAKAHADFLISQSSELWIIKAPYFYDNENGKITVLDPEIQPVKIPDDC